MASSAAPDIRVRFAAEGEAGVTAAIQALTVQLAQLNKQQQTTAASAKQLANAEEEVAYSAQEARGAAKLLGEETGVNLNRHLASVLANSKVLGPLLEAAFPVAAAIGFIEVIAHAAEKLSEFIADTFIFTDEMKEIAKAGAEADKVIAANAAHVEQLKKAYALIGLSGVAKDMEELRQKTVELDKAEADLRAAQDAMYWMRERGTEQSSKEYQTRIDAANIASSKIRTITQEQYNLEKQLLIDDEKAKKDAADKAEREREARAKAIASLIKSQLAEQLALFRDYNAQQEEANKAAYDRGLEDTKTYFAKRLQLLQDAQKKEMDAREAARAELVKQLPESYQGMSQAELDASQGAGLPTKQLAVLQQVQQLDAQIQQARITNQTQLNTLRDAAAKAEEDNYKKRLEYEAQIAQAQGRTYDAAQLRLQAQAIDLKRNLGQLGADAAALGEQLTTLQAAHNEFSDEQVRSAQQLFAIETKRVDLQNQVANGLITQANATKQLADEERNRLPTLEAIALEMQKTADITKDPALIQAAIRFRQQIDQIKTSLDTTGQAAAKLAQGIEQTLTSSLTTFFTQTIQSAKSVGDAFRSLASDIVSSLQKIVVQMLINLAIQRLMQAFSFSGGGSAGGATSGGVPEYGSAEGGLVQGPGTATSDSIPARLSTGEFVVRAAAVNAIGIDTLAMINRGMSRPAFAAGGYVPKFATGGLVTSEPGNSAMDLILRLGLEDGIVVKHLASPKAGRVIVQQLANNSKGAGKALSRGQ
jgi:hypothetical protein